MDTDPGTGLWTGIAPSLLTGDIACPSTTYCWTLNSVGTMTRTASTAAYTDIQFTYSVATTDNLGPSDQCIIQYSTDGVTYTNIKTLDNKSTESVTGLTETYTAWGATVQLRPELHIQLEFVGSGHNCYFNEFKLEGILTANPTSSPSSPTSFPSTAPTTASPSGTPTKYPTSNPTTPSNPPTFYPTLTPTDVTVDPTATPSVNPSSAPTKSPTFHGYWSSTYAAAGSYSAGSYFTFETYDDSYINKYCIRSGWYMDAFQAYFSNGDQTSLQGSIDGSPWCSGTLSRFDCYTAIRVWDYSYIESVQFGTYSGQWDSKKGGLDDSTATLRTITGGVGECITRIEVGFTTSAHYMVSIQVYFQETNLETHDPTMHPTIIPTLVPTSPPIIPTFVPTSPPLITVYSTVPESRSGIVLTENTESTEERIKNTISNTNGNFSENLTIVLVILCVVLLIAAIVSLILFMKYRKKTVTKINRVLSVSKEITVTDIDVHTETMKTTEDKWCEDHENDGESGNAVARITSGGHGQKAGGDNHSDVDDSSDDIEDMFDPTLKIQNVQSLSSVTASGEEQPRSSVYHGYRDQFALGNCGLSGTGPEGVKERNGANDSDSDSAEELFVEMKDEKTVSPKSPGDTETTRDVNERHKDPKFRRAVSDLSDIFMEPKKSVLDAYIEEFGECPRNATQLMNFSKIDGRYKVLSFKEAKEMLSMTTAKTNTGKMLSMMTAANTEKNVKD